MFQPDAPPFLTLSQGVYLLIAGFLSGGGIAAWVVLWQRRKHGPAEVKKLEAEARSIAVRDDLAVGDTVIKLIKEVSQATGEVRQMREERNEWERRAEQLLEDLTERDDELAQAKKEYEQLMTRYNKKVYELGVAMRILAENQISYSEGDDLRHLIDHPIKP